MKIKIYNRYLKAIAGLGFASGSCFFAGAQTFNDPLTSTLNPTYWSINQTSAGMYSTSYSSAGLSASKVGNNPGGLNNISYNLNLDAIGASTGDFQTFVTISNAVLGNSDWDQIQLNASFQDGSTFDDVYDNSVQNPGVHVWNGSLNGSFGVSTNTGTFEITRTGSTLSGYWGSTLIYSEAESSALTSLNFVLQNNNSSNDNISVTFSNFSFSPASSAPEPASLGLLGLGALVVIRRVRPTRRS